MYAVAMFMASVSEAKAHVKETVYRRISIQVIMKGPAICRIAAQLLDGLCVRYISN